MAGITYALIVAVEDYNQPKHFKKVRYASKDATEFKNALQLSGVEEDNITLLLNSAATKTALKKEISEIARKALEPDRTIFYFSGHGAFDSSENYLLPVDCYNDDIPGTALAINSILGVLKKSLCTRNILFLDCCHSGFEPGDDTKTTDKSFLADKLIYEARGEEYTIGFASCKSNQTSITHPRLQHSVWTYFLIEALKGEAGKIYDHGLLFSDKLQTYLKNQTKEYVKLNTDDKKDQVPVTFGNSTDKFLIADLNPLFEERERSKKVDDISFTNISLIREEDGKIKSLPGFQKRSHNVPTTKNYTTDNFVKRVGNQIVEEEISDLSKQIRTELGYKLREVEVNTDEGSGAINTPHFTYSMEITQSSSAPSEYILIRKLLNFKSSEIVFKPEFNNIFAAYFHKLKFTLSKRIDIEKFINDFEDLEDLENITIDYNPSDLSYCTLNIKGSNHDLVVTTNSISLVSNHRTSPQNLINAYRESHKLLLSNPDLKLLE
jgi:hypothetical protein